MIAFSPTNDLRSMPVQPNTVLLSLYPHSVLKLRKFSIVYASASVKESLTLQLTLPPFVSVCVLLVWPLGRARNWHRKSWGAGTIDRMEFDWVLSADAHNSSSAYRL